MTKQQKMERLAQGAVEMMAELLLNGYGPKTTRIRHETNAAIGLGPDEMPDEANITDDLDTDRRDLKVAVDLLNLGGTKMTDAQLEAVLLGHGEDVDTIYESVPSCLRAHVLGLAFQGILASRRHDEAR